MRGMNSQRQKRAAVSKNFPTQRQPMAPPGPPVAVSSNNNEKQPIQKRDTSKISISDAIGLITIRLSKLETQISTGNFKSNSDDNTSGSMQYVDKNTIIDIVNRISELENQDNSEKLESKEINDELDLVNENISNLDAKVNKLYEMMDNFELKLVQTINNSDTVTNENLSETTNQSIELHVTEVYNNEESIVSSSQINDDNNDSTSTENNTLEEVKDPDNKQNNEQLI